jgi:hypothetical protein
MRTFLTLAAIVCVLLVGPEFPPALEVLPYLILGLVIGAIIRTRRQRRPAPAHGPPLATGGWAYIPVCVAWPPHRTVVRVIDAEVVRDVRDG